MLLFQTGNVIVQGLEQRLLRVLVEESQHSVEVSEEMYVVDSLLHFQTVEGASPDVLVPVLKMLHLDHEIVESLLVMVDLGGP